MHQPAAAAAAAASASDRSTKEIADYIEETVHAITDAVNQRDLEPHSTEDSDSVWNRFTDDFGAEPEYLSTATIQHNQKSEHPLPLKMSEGDFKLSVVGPERLKELFRRFVDVYPDYRMRVTDVSTEVHEKARWAISYVSMETTDMPPGVTRPSVGVFEWKMIKGKWLLSKYEGMAGIRSD